MCIVIHALTTYLQQKMIIIHSLLYFVTECESPAYMYNTGPTTIAVSATQDKIGISSETILPSIQYSSDFGRQAESSSVSAPITTTGLPQPSSSPMNSPQVTPAATTTQPQEVNVGLFAGIAVSVAVLVLLVILTAVILLVCVVKSNKKKNSQGGI